MSDKTANTGIPLAFLCLSILGIMPIISNSRPGSFDALSFAFFLSAWQVLFSLPLVFRELRSKNKGIFEARLPTALKRRTIVVILLTGVIFGLSTYVYVLAVEKAGAVGAAVAIQAYPLFAILWETLFLGRRKSPLELLFLGLLLTALYYLATSGTWRIEGFSGWFVFAMAIPLLWSIAHVIIKEVLGASPITPAQVTFFRVAVSTAFLFVVVIVVQGPSASWQVAANFDFQKFAMLMGLVYYLELICWFYAVKYIDVSMASSITAPAPALTMVLAVLLLGDRVETYQIATLFIVVASIYGLLLAGRKPLPADARQ